MCQQSPLISVIIPAYNAQETLGACLDGLERQTLPRENYETIVVDDGSTDGTREAAADRDVTLISRSHQGVAAARNAGTKHSQREIILFTDADCIPQSDWIETMARPFADKDVVGVSGRVSTHQKGLVPRFVQLEYDYRYENVARHASIDFISAAAAAYRREIFLKAGGFREDLLDAEDAELSFRVASAGWKMVFAPQAIVYHPHPGSIVEYARRKYRYGYWRVMACQKHPQKAISDSRTPQSQKIQIGLLFLLAVAVIASIFLRELAWLNGGLALLFLLASVPFWWWALWRDLQVGLLTPLFLVVATSSVGAGVIVALAHQSLQRLKGWL